MFLSKEIAEAICRKYLNVTKLVENTNADKHKSKGQILNQLLYIHSGEMLRILTFHKKKKKKKKKKREWKKSKVKETTATTTLQQVILIFFKLIIAEKEKSHVHFPFHL